MHLQGKPPIRMGFHSLHTSLHIGFTLFFVFLIARLQKTVFGFNVVILRQILPKIHHFQFVATFQRTRLRITTMEG